MGLKTRQSRNETRHVIRVPPCLITSMSLDNPNKEKYKSSYFIIYHPSLLVGLMQLSIVTQPLTTRGKRGLARWFNFVLLCNGQGTTLGTARDCGGHFSCKSPSRSPPHNPRHPWSRVSAYAQPKDAGTTKRIMVYFTEYLHFLQLLNLNKSKFYPWLASFNNPRVNAISFEGLSTDGSGYSTCHACMETGICQSSVHAFKTCESLLIKETQHRWDYFFRTCRGRFPAFLKEIPPRIIPG